MDPTKFPKGPHVNAIRARKRIAGEKWAGGNHWHSETEYFRIVRGNLKKLILENIDTGERKVWKNLGPGTTIEIPARVAHATFPSNGLVLVGVLLGGFNQNDLNPYKLMDDDGNELPSPFEKT